MRLSLMTAVLAVLAAFVAAIGPAAAERAGYTWPPAAIPQEAPRKGWYTPLPLLNRVPSSLEVKLPCGLSQPLGRAGRTVLLSTTRRSQDSGGLQILLVADSIQIRVGRSDVASVPWPASCPLLVDVRAGRLRTASRDVALHTGAPDEMPIVTGLFTGLDLRSGSPPAVSLRTRTYATSYTGRQNIAAAAAILFAFAALILLSRRERPRFLQSGRRLLVRAWQAREAADVVVVGVLLVWWIVAPTFRDDGWLWIENRSFDDLGAVSFYFDNWGLTPPLGNWVVWVEHGIVGATNDLVFTRLPSLLVLLATWPLSRYCLQLAVSPGPVTRGARWTLAAAFLVGSLAWGMTLRPEPLIAFLALTTLVAMLSFKHSPRIAPLLLVVPAVVLAICAHPTGLVVASPLIAGVPHLLRELRHNIARWLTLLGILGLAALALVLILFSIDADLGQRLADARLVSEGELHSDPFWREFVRYTRFDDRGGATAVRHLSLVLLLIPVLAALTRRRLGRSGSDFALLPAHSVAIGLVLLAFVPSKWPWHFGALAVIGAVSAATEVERIAQESRTAPGGRVRQLLALAFIFAAGLWAWSATGPWSQLDIQRLSWNDGFNVYPWLLGVPALGVGLLIAAHARARRAERGSPFDVAQSVLTWTIPALSFAAISITVAILVLDAARTPWSPARQNLEALVGDSSCGIANQLRGDPEVVAEFSNRSNPALLVPSVALYYPCATPPALEDGLVELPRLLAFQGDAWPLFVRDGPFVAARDLYHFERIGTAPRGVEAYSVTDSIPGYTKLDVVRPTEAR
jgi:arabinosyltransferase B